MRALATFLLVYCPDAHNPQGCTCQEFSPGLTSENVCIFMFICTFVCFIFCINVALNQRGHKVFIGLHWLIQWLYWSTAGTILLYNMVEFCSF